MKNPPPANTRTIPQSAEDFIQLGVKLEESKQFSAALMAYQRALALQADSVPAKINIGRLLLLQRRSEEALKILEEARAQAPNFGMTYALIGQALSNLQLMQQAVTFQRRGLALDVPDGAALAHTLSFNLNYMPDCTVQELFDAHQFFGQRYCSEFYPQNPYFDNRPDPERPLKIGYVSGDFREHPVGQFIEPAFAHHNPAQFEIHAFYNHGPSDTLTARLRSHVAHWHPIAGQDDDTVADLIRTLGIDLLIDLSGHTEHHRLFVFARKPAPVQATWLGYPGTTGLATMDYRICDAYTDPPGLTERFHTEKVLRLPECQWCHKSYDDLPSIGELPLSRTGWLTLGSFNRPAKLNEQVLALWTEILKAIPQSRLILAVIPSQRTADHFSAILQKAGITHNRFTFMPQMPSKDYMVALTSVDILLDPFPYTGATTTFDALIMGVPVVTLAGDRSVARCGVSLLANLGLPELIAETPQDYVDIVKQLADDPAHLAALRSSLRDRMLASPLMNGERFTRQLEAAYRQMWRTWCDSQR